MLRQHVVLLCLQVKKTSTYRDLVDELIEMPRIREALNLDVIPAPSTLCKAFSRLEMAVWRVLLNVSLADLPLNGVTGIDASGFERSHASAHYTKRTSLTIQQLKTTLLIDTATNAVLDIHVTTAPYASEFVVRAVALVGGPIEWLPAIRPTGPEFGYHRGTPRRSLECVRPSPSRRSP